MKKIIILISVILIIVNLIVIHNYIFKKSVLTKIFGFGILVVNSGSMSPTINVGEVIVIKEQKMYKTGDVITVCIDNKYLITHRIVEEKDNKYITKGDNNNCIDEKITQKEEIEGKVIFHSKLLGKIYQYRYYIFIIFAIIIIFLILF